MAKFPPIFVSLAGNRGTLKRRNMKLGPLLAVLFSMLIIEMALAGSLLQQFYHAKRKSSATPIIAREAPPIMGHSRRLAATPPATPPPPPPAATPGPLVGIPKNFYARDYELVRHSLVSGVVGIGANCVAGLQLMLSWTPESLITDSAVALVDLAFSFTTLGHSAKELNEYGRNKGWRNQDRRMRTLQAFTIITGILKLVKLTMIHTSLFGDIYE